MAPTVELDATLDAGETTVSPDQGGFADATLFDVLGNERRRTCLHCLAEHETVLSLSTLSE
ncbi:hypothetical protein [Haloarcula argentinensis]|uniref:Uncharacterized protein n=1 Tax=Haloarcula argentinensis TaxID=43776 RepID=A0A830FW09_HALAR|nr:hypothetical protein [Haloarcula argentinensis]EMA18477.1 hypothetical protein C443_18304 [Haloarcula argentinensis DSM 12282]GGM45242.1 hypothetical protein GCM10009006_28270 [Haloarcula argentinensis]